MKASDVPDFIHDQERWSCIEADLVGQASLTLSLDQGLDELGQCCAIDLPSSLHSRYAQCRRQVRLAGTRRAQEVDDLGAANEVQLRQRGNCIALCCVVA